MIKVILMLLTMSVIALVLPIVADLLMKKIYWLAIPLYLSMFGFIISMGYCIIKKDKE